MEPAQPPFPMASNLPFQLIVGNHTSKLMLESEVGFSTPTTRQNSGTGVAGPVPAGPPVPRPCATSPPTGGGSSLGGGGSGRGATGTGVPATRNSINVIVVSGSDKVLRCSQGVAANSVPNNTKAPWMTIFL